MHGIVFVELEKYARTRLGTEGWEQLKSAAGLENQRYRLSQAFPDDEAARLMAAAEKATGMSTRAMLEDFGSFIAPDLLGLYGSLIDKSWKTLDTIEHTEATIHTVVRVKNPGALPPALETKRQSPTLLVMKYRSPRKMCALAIGIAKGIAAHHRENLTVTEPRCMHRGDTECELHMSIG
jgi:hypothetical protein